jgi:hypothetical protein
MAQDPFAQYATKDDPFAAFAVKDAPAEPTTAKPVAAGEPDTFWGGVGKSLKEQFSAAAGPVPEAGEMPFAHATSPRVQAVMSTPLARPTGIDAVDGFLSPAGLAMTAIGAGSALHGNPTAQKAIGRTLRAVGDFEVTKPLKILGKIGEHVENRAANAIEAQGSPNATSTSHWLPERPAPVEPQAAPADLSQPVRPGQMSQAEILERVRAVKANGGLPAGTQAQMPQVRGVLRMGHTVEPTAATAPPPQAAIPEAWKPFAEPQAAEPHPMQGPRIKVGAEEVGRATGKTKQAVRDQTGPLYGEAPGEASPIAPTDPLDRMHDKMLEMGHGNPARKAYVEAAGDPKTRTALAALRYTMERNGLVVAGASTAELLRQAIKARLLKPAEDSQSRQ